MFNLRRKHQPPVPVAGEAGIQAAPASVVGVVAEAGMQALARHVMLEASRAASRLLLECHELTANDVKEGFTMYESYVTDAKADSRIKDFVEVLGNGNAQHLVSIVFLQKRLQPWPFVVTPPHDYYRSQGTDIAPLLRMTGCMVLWIERHTWNVMTLGGCNPYTVSECAKAISAVRRQAGQSLPFIFSATLSIETWKGELDKHFGGTHNV